MVKCNREKKIKIKAELMENKERLYHTNVSQSCITIMFSK